MAEWFKALVLKTSDTARYRGFESLSLRHSYSSCSVMQKYPRGRRGSPAKGVGCDKRREGSNPSFCAIVGRTQSDAECVLSYMPMHSPFMGGSTRSLHAPNATGCLLCLPGKRPDYAPQIKQRPSMQMSAPARQKVYLRQHVRRK